MTEEELKRHCEKTVVSLSMKGELTGPEQRRKEEHQLVLEIIEERDDWWRRCQSYWDGCDNE